MKPYKAIFLDWDDTIGDWKTAEHKALQDIYATYRLDRLYPAFEDYLNTYKPYNLELWGMYGRGEVTKEWLQLQRFLKPIEGLPVTGEGLQELAHKMGAEFLRLTNKYFCLLPDAEEVVKYEEVGINKPQPGIFQIALERNGVTADEVVMVGDSYWSDIAGAKAAGIDQIWIKDERVKGLEDEGLTATYMISHLADVMKIV